jgi:hypothetical protein
LAPWDYGFEFYSWACVTFIRLISHPRNALVLRYSVNLERGIGTRKIKLSFSISSSLRNDSYVEKQV